MTELLKVAEVAKWLRVSEGTVRNFIKRGNFPGVLMGRALRIRRADVEAWLESCTVTPGEVKDDKDI